MKKVFLFILAGLVVGAYFVVKGTEVWSTYTDPFETYSFEYPQKLFAYMEEPVSLKGPLESGQNWANQKPELDRGEIMDTQVMFEKKYITLQTSHYYDLGYEIKTNGLTVSGMKTTKLSDVITEYEQPGHYYGWDAQWVMKPCVYRISMSVYDQNNWQDYRKTFEKIAGSMKFYPDYKNAEGNVICADEAATIVQ